MKKELKWSLFIFAIGVFMAALDNGIITASLTTLIYAFDVPATWGVWTVTLYTLGLAISVPIVGKLSDQFGRKKLFLIEVALFGIGSLLVAFSMNFTMFLASRFIQALGGGGIFIIASSYILNTFPKEKQGRALGLLGGMNGIAAILGPVVGALILKLTGSWHWLFLINIPIALLLIYFGYRFINEDQELITEKIDWLGIFFLATAILSLMYSLTTLEGSNLIKSLANPIFLTFASMGVLLLLILFFIEKRIEAKGHEPVLPLSLLALPKYRLTLVLAALSGMVLAAVIFMPGYIEQYLGIPRELSGFWFTPLALASGIGAGGGGALVDKKGPIFTLTTASIVAAIGFILFPLWVESVWQMVVASSLVGLGFGAMLGAPINVLATEDTDKRKGVALGTTSLFRQIGMTLAPTLYAGFLARSFSNLNDKVEKNLEDAGLSPNKDLFIQDSVQVSDFATIQESYSQIPDEETRNVLLQTLHNIVESGYNGLFYAAMTISLLALGTVMILKRYRENKIG